MGHINIDSANISSKVSERVAMVKEERAKRKKEFGKQKTYAEFLEEQKRKKFKDEIYGYLVKEQPQLIEKLASQRVLTDDIKNGLDEAFQKFFA